MGFKIQISEPTRRGFSGAIVYPLSRSTSDAMWDEQNARDSASYLLAWPKAIENLGAGERIRTFDPDLGKEISRTMESANSTQNEIRATAVTPDVTLSAATDHGKVG
jgi:hypothetical protein